MDLPPPPSIVLDRAYSIDTIGYVSVELYWTHEPPDRQLHPRRIQPLQHNYLRNADLPLFAQSFLATRHKSRRRRWVPMPIVAQFVSALLNRPLRTNLASFTARTTGTIDYSTSARLPSEPQLSLAHRWRRVREKDETASWIGDEAFHAFARKKGPPFAAPRLETLHVGLRLDTGSLLNLVASRLRTIKKVQRFCVRSEEGERGLYSQKHKRRIERLRRRQGVFFETTLGGA